MRFFSLLVLALLSCFSVGAQAPAADPPAPAGFLKYYLVILTKGPRRDQDSATVRQLQSGHLANMDRLAAAGKLVLAGPFLDDGNWRGLFMLKAASLAEARTLLDTDPMIQVGRLSYEMHPWMTQAILEKTPLLEPEKKPAPALPGSKRK